MITPRSSSLSCRNVSASSTSKVGRYPSTTRKIAAAVTFAVGSGRNTKRASTSSSVVFPHCLTGEQIASRGDTRKRSSRYVCTTHSAAMVALVLRHDDVRTDRSGNRVEQRSAVDRVGPRLRLGETRSRGLAVAVVLVESELRALVGDQAIEDRGANTKLLGGLLALALVLHRRHVRRVRRSACRRRRRRFASPPCRRSALGSHNGASFDRLDEVDAGAIGLEEIGDVAAVLLGFILGEQVDDLQRFGDLVERSRDLLAVLAAGRIGVDNDDDAPTFERLDEFGFRPWFRF